MDRVVSVGCKSWMWVVMLCGGCPIEGPSFISRTVTHACLLGGFPDLHNPRHSDCKGRTTTRLTLDRDVAAHHLTEAFTDREPEAGAAVSACGGCIGLGEFLEQVDFPEAHTRTIRAALCQTRKSSLQSPRSAWPVAAHVPRIGPPVRCPSRRRAISKDHLLGQIDEGAQARGHVAASWIIEAISGIGGCPLA